MKYTYLLEHSYEDERGFDIYKTLGFFQQGRKLKPHRICTAKSRAFEIIRWIVFALMNIPSMLDIGQQVLLTTTMQISTNKLCVP